MSKAKDLLCEHPRVITRRNIRDIQRGAKYFHTPHGDYDLSDIDFYSYPALSFYHPSRLGVTLDNYEDYYLVYPDGVIECPYMVVPCNHCVLCNDRRRRQFMLRCEAEAQMSTAVPLFITFTYDNRFLPKCGVSVREFQLFLKRFRIAYYRKYGFTLDLRYIACGEYGSMSGRPHYHAIFFNVNIDRSKPTFRSFRDLYELLYSCWKFGKIKAKRCDTGAIGYVCKYMTKPQVVPDDCNPGFILSSKGRGGIGSRYIDSKRDYYESNIDDVYIAFKCKWTGKVVKSLMPKYFRDRLFPSISRAIPLEIRKECESLIDLVNIFDFLDTNGYISSAHVPIVPQEIEPLLRIVLTYDRDVSILDLDTQYFVESCFKLHDNFSDGLLYRLRYRFRLCVEKIRSYDFDPSKFALAAILRNRFMSRFESVAERMVNNVMNAPREQYIDILRNEAKRISPCEVF